MAKGYEEFRVHRLKYESSKAYLFEFEGFEEEGVWVPKSQCDWDPDSRTAHISSWLITQKTELEDVLKAQGNATD